MGARAASNFRWVVQMSKMTRAVSLQPPREVQAKVSCSLPAITIGCWRANKERQATMQLAALSHFLCMCTGRYCSNTDLPLFCLKEYRSWHPPSGCRALSRRALLFAVAAEAILRAKPFKRRVLLFVIGLLGSTWHRRVIWLHNGEGTDAAFH